MSTQTQSPEGIPPLQAVPADFTPFETRSRFVQLCGPMYEKVFEDGTMGLGLLLEEKHLNQLDVPHGGILLLLADNAMGRALTHQSNWTKQYLTLALNSQFISLAKPGDFIYAKPIIHRIGKRIAFIDCDIFAGEKKVFHASGTFALTEKTP